MVTRRQRELREQRRQNVVEWIREQKIESSCLPSNYDIKTLKRLARKQSILAVVCYCRVSDRKQDLQAQITGTRLLVRKMGIEVKGRRYGDVADGRELDQRSRPDLYEAIGYARRQGIPLVLPCISRAIRNKGYRACKWPECDYQPTKEEFEEFLQVAKGVTLATLNNPDASCPEDEEYLRDVVTAPVKMRLNPGRKRKKGAGYCKARKARYSTLAIRLRESGWSWRDIAQKVSQRSKRPISYTGVRKWVQEAVN